jgi:uncharacterized protein (TIGR02001 family)
MKKIVMAAVAALATSAAPALAADLVTKARPLVAAPVSPWDIAFGAGIASDYNFRGISQSDLGPSVNAYFEPRFNINPNLQLYAGIAGASVKLATDPAAEIDFYAGIRPTFGPVAFDFGYIYYYYPKERAIDGVAVAVPNGNTTLGNTDFWEVYGKALWTVNPVLALGANLFYSPSWLNTGADGTYLSGTGKITMPTNMLPADVGAYLSGEFGYYWFGQTDRAVSPTGVNIFVSNNGLTGWDLPDYAYWNLGVGFTYKVFTLDLRYHDTDLSKAECNALTADPGAGVITPTIVNNSTQAAGSKWCGATFIAKLSVDLTLASLK